MPLIIIIFLILPYEFLHSMDEYFLTLRNEKVNLRQGPSFDYPIKIFYKKKFLPVLIQDKSDNFRKIRDHENNSGWIHISQLSKKKAAITIDDNLIMFSSSTLLGGMGDDHITLTTDVPDPKITPSTNTKQKYSEDVIIKELKDYITRTYDQHYSAGSDKIQTLDLIEACGDGEAFCRSNILKYASRYDKKGTARRDIMKILHYAVLLMHFNDKNAQNETYPQ